MKRAGILLLLSFAAAASACEIVYGFDGYEDGGAGGPRPEGGADASVDQSTTGSDASSDGGADAGADGADAGRGDSGCDACGPFVFAAAPGGRDLAGDDAALYWLSITGSSGSLMRTDRGDAATTVLVADAGTNPSGLGVDDTRIYWTTRTVDASAGTGTVQTVAKDGGARAVIATGTSWYPTTVAVDGTSVYIESPTTNGDALVSRVAKDGGARATLVLPPANQDSTLEREGVAVDDTYVYYLHYSEVYRLPKDCPDASACTPTPVMIESFSEYDVDSFSIDDAAVYWTMRYPGTHPCGLYRVAKGGDAEVNVLPQCGFGTGLDDTWAYLFTYGSEQLVAAPKTGGGSTATLTLNQPTPKTPMFDDDRAAYWINAQTSAIMELPR